MRMIDDLAEPEKGSDFPRLVTLFRPVFRGLICGTEPDYIAYQKSKVTKQVQAGRKLLALIREHAPSFPSDDVSAKLEEFERLRDQCESVEDADAAVQYAAKLVDAVVDAARRGSK